MSRATSAMLQQAMYRPGIAGVLLNPFYIARAGLWRAVARHAPRLGGRVLDIGCGTKPYRDLFGRTEYLGVDVERRGAEPERSADLVYDGRALPFADASFDGVVCNQVLEHVRDPDALIGGIHRLLRPGGLLLLTVPFVWDEHEQPEDYHRFTSHGLRALMGRHGLEILVQEKISPDAGLVFQLFNAYLHKITLPLPRWLRIALRLAIAMPVTVTGLVAARLLPDNPDLYLDQLVVARK